MNPGRLFNERDVERATHLIEIAAGILSELDIDFLTPTEEEGLQIAGKALALACDAIQQNVKMDSVAPTTYRFNGRKDASGDYIVRCYKGNQHWPAGDYHTDDKQDALDTMADLRKRANQPMTRDYIYNPGN